MNERLILLRKTLNLSQQEFADKIGISRSLLSLLEANLTPILNRHIILICSTFNVNLEWFIKGTLPIFNNDNNFKEFYEIYKNLSDSLQEFLLKVCKDLLDAQNKL